MTSDATKPFGMIGGVESIATDQHEGGTLVDICVCWTGRPNESGGGV